MDKSILVQYCDIRAEVKDLEQRISTCENQRSKIVVDNVRGSSAEFPYVEHNFVIEGVAAYRPNATLNKNKKMLKVSYEKLLEIKTNVEEYIEKIPYSRIRRIFRYRYIDDKNWTQIGHMMGGNSTVHSVRMEHNRFLEKN